MSGRYLICIIALFSIFTNVAQAKICVYVASYHQGYEWNDGIELGLEKTLKSKCKLHKFYMNTKRNTDPNYAKSQALKAKAYIKEQAADIVIASDDNAIKYLISKYFKNTDTPVVFCGINWTVHQYGLPFTNATGMIEVAPIKPLLEEIRNIVDKPKTGIYLSADVLTEHKDYDRYKRVYNKAGINLLSSFVSSMKQWKNAYIKAQRAGIDFIILNNNSGINDWDNEIAKSIALQHAKVLTVTNYKWMMPYSMFAMTKLPQEQGEWAAKVALSILDGMKPSAIPIVVNRRWDTFFNPLLLKQAKIDLPIDIKLQAIQSH